MGLERKQIEKRRPKVRSEGRDSSSRERISPFEILRIWKVWGRGVERKTFAETPISKNMGMEQKGIEKSRDFCVNF